MKMLQIDKAIINTANPYFARYKFELVGMADYFMEQCYFSVIALGGLRAYLSLSIDVPSVMQCDSAPCLNGERGSHKIIIIE